MKWFINGNRKRRDKKTIFKINPKINIYLGKYEPTNTNEFRKNDKYIVFSGIEINTFVSMIKNYELNFLKDIEFQITTI